MFAHLPRAGAQPATPHIGYVYPAGGRLGTTFQVTVGGQFLEGVTNVFVSGDGIAAAVIEFNKPMPQNQFNQLRDQLRALQDRKQAARRASNATNTWSNADETELAGLREKILKNPPNRQGNPAIAETVTIQVELSPSAFPGARELRLGTPNGLSNPLVFQVGELREFTAPPARARNPEAERFRERLGRSANANPTSPETRVTLPAIVNGQIMPGEVDRIRFTARKGQRLVFAVQARELIPYLADAVPGWFQATLALYDAQGKELAYADDFRFHPDPVLGREIPRDGDYVVEIKDAIYRGREDFVYRLTLGELPYVTSIFPLGSQAGVPVAVEFAGWNLAGGSPTQIVQFAAPGVYQLSVTNGEHASNLMPFAVDTLPDSLEHEPNNNSRTAQRVKLPIIINGRINNPGDADVFRFRGRAGDEIVAAVTARALNSPLDSVLRLTGDSGQLIAVNDDFEDKGAGRQTHHADSYLRATLPTNGEYHLHITDAQQQGGPEFAYRLRLSPPRPDFQLRVVPSSLAVRGGGTVPLTIFALRKDGFTNDIALALRDAPAGFSVSGAVVPAGQDQIRFTLTAPQRSADESFLLALEGRARVAGAEMIRPVVPADDQMQAFLYRHLVPAREFRVAVFGRGPQRGLPRILSETPIYIPVGGTARLRVAAPAGAALDRMQLELIEPPEGLSIREVLPARNGAEIVLQAESGKTTAGLSGNLILQAFAARATVPGRSPANNQRRGAPTAWPAIPFQIVAAE